MNYYEHHIGDYAEATSHLSFVEDAAYSRLLRKCYASEKPLPVDIKAVQRLVGARSKDEREAVCAVLEEFFTLQDDGWHNQRCDEEIARYQDKQRKAKRSANARWNKHQAHSDGNANASKEAMRTHSDGNAHHTPDTKHQSPDTSKNTQGGVCVSAGGCCKAMMEVGISGCNPSHPVLLAMIEAGADEAEFRNAAKAALERGKSTFAYVIGIVKRQREDAAGMVLHKAPADSTPGKPEKFDPVAYVNNGTPQTEGGNGRVIEHAA